jgi:hypothetical protein
MRPASVEHSVQPLTKQTVDRGDWILTEIEPIKTDHLDAKAFQHLFSLKIILGQIGPPCR